MKKLNNCQIIVINNIEGTWSKKDVFDVLAFGDWGVVKALKNKQYVVFHIPSGLTIKHVKDKKSAKMLAKKLSKNIKTVWKCENDHTVFIDWYMELINKMNIIELDVALFQLVEITDISEEHDVPF